MIPFRFHIAIVLALLTAVPMSRYPETQKVRKPAVAGSFYPASAREIKSMAGPWLHPAAGGDHLIHFSAEEKRAMLAAARASIYSALSGL